MIASGLEVPLLRPLVVLAGLAPACIATCDDPLAVDWVSIPGQTIKVARHEVTVRQYRACVEAGACDQPEAYEGCSWGRPGMDEHPVNCVSWEMATAYATWAGGRLATEEEWSLAAKGGQDLPYAGSDLPDGIAWTAENSRGAVQPVCTRKPNGYGLCDMSGNLWEYTATVHPQPEGDGKLGYVGKGGSWAYTVWYAKIDAPPGYSPGIRCDSMGIRPVRDEEER